MRWILFLLLFLAPSVAYGQAYNNLFCRDGRCGNQLFASQSVPTRTITPVVTQRLQTTPRWTWPGDLSNHLRSTHGVNPAGMSHQQMVNMHSHLHNTQQRTYQPTYQPLYQSNCPGGVCPTQPTTRRIFRRWR